MNKILRSIQKIRLDILKNNPPEVIASAYEQIERNEIIDLINRIGSHSIQRYSRDNGFVGWDTNQSGATDYKPQVSIYTSSGQSNRRGEGAHMHWVSHSVPLSSDIGLKVKPSNLNEEAVIIPVNPSKLNWKEYYDYIVTLVLEKKDIWTLDDNISKFMIQFMYALEKEVHGDRTAIDWNAHVYVNNKTGTIQELIRNQKLNKSSAASAISDVLQTRKRNPRQHQTDGCKKVRCGQPYSKEDFYQIETEKKKKKYNLL